MKFNSYSDNCFNWGVWFIYYSMVGIYTLSMKIFWFLFLGRSGVAQRRQNLITKLQTDCEASRNEFNYSHKSCITIWCYDLHFCGPWSKLQTIWWMVHFHNGYVSQWIWFSLFWSSPFGGIAHQCSFNPFGNLFVFCPSFNPYPSNSWPFLQMIKLSLLNSSCKKSKHQRHCYR